MMILTNGLTDVVDEGFLKVANSLVKRLKAHQTDLEVVSYDRRSGLTDTYICVNKLMLNRTVYQLCRKHKRVLYIPFPTKKWVMAMRVFLLSLWTEKLRVMLVLKTPIGILSHLLLKASGAEIVVFSKDARDFYAGIVGEHRVSYIKTGVDTEKFQPVSQETATQLKRKYGLDPEKRIILHVGHLNEGRNIRELMKISNEHQILLITSTLTKDEQDPELKKQLLLRENFCVIDDYISDIQEIYQLSDAYFFPVLAAGHCIDVPLSCMEAAACNKPIITTRYGEMKEFSQTDGVYYIDDFDAEHLNVLIDQVLRTEKIETRAAVLPYDWRNAVVALLNE